ncbi:uncharacterized protein ARMOST_16709 [Armillaria ostoyae]|uniref:Uncharacterized protein n=1 Tax=Armillaria ostoyae TaxID=47428 RepID=A0A284RX02_ARMOS|nr:uncharacterized protein ARMOST_16709 [Armillaria ostoyae]
MVNWRDATTIAEQFRKYLPLETQSLHLLVLTVGVIKVTHFCAGIFLWEFLSTLDYEYTVYTGKRPFRWTLIIYLLTRYATMGAMLCYMIGFNDSNEFDCVAWLKATYAFSYGSLALASALIGMRAYDRILSPGSRTDVSVASLFGTVTGWSYLSMSSPGWSM